MQMRHQKSVVRRQMATPRHQYKPIGNNRNEIQPITTPRTSMSSPRKICKGLLPKNELISHTHDNTTHLKVVSVVGASGSGKTALARRVYEDANLKRQFESHAWVTIPQTFESKFILKKLIQELHVEIGQEVPDQVLDSMDVRSLRVFLKDFLQDRKYIIIFDDIRSTEAWEAFRYALPDCNCRSRVILTTRSDDVASASCNQNSGSIYRIPQLLRFGPIYYVDDSSDSAQEDAWKQVYENSKVDDKEELLDIYLSAIRRVEKKARATYGDEALNGLTESQFRWMMVQDGCLFLQLALFILGASQQLGYPEDHIIFGTKQENNKKKVARGWIDTMFHVGNQIPLVVLNELMKQTFFQDVIINHGNWKKPTDLLSHVVLYELLIPPAVEFANYSRKASPILYEHGRTYLSTKQPSDVLHGLQILVLGPRGSINESKKQSDEDEEEIDLEAGGTLSTEAGVGNDKELCVSGYGKKGIYFWKSNGVGFRSVSGFTRNGICFGKPNGVGIRSGIEFKNRMLYAGLYLPTLPVNQDTEILFKNLKYYEIYQQQNEVRSYLGLMNQLISTYEDVHYLASKGIIEIDEKTPHYKDSFLRMLRNLSETATTHHHRYVLRKLRDHPSFPWEIFKYGAAIVFVLTVVQAVFGVLSYVVGKQQLNQSHA